MTKFSNMAPVAADGPPKYEEDVLPVRLSLLFFFLSSIFLNFFFFFFFRPTMTQSRTRPRQQPSPLDPQLKPLCLREGRLAMVGSSCLCYWYVFPLCVDLILVTSEITLLLFSFLSSLFSILFFISFHFLSFFLSFFFFFSFFLFFEFFFFSSTVSWIFGILGFLCVFLMSQTHAGRTGARAGLGLMFIHLGFYVRKFPHLGGE